MLSTLAECTVLNLTVCRPMFVAEAPMERERFVEFELVQVAENCFWEKMLSKMK